MHRTLRPLEPKSMDFEFPNHGPVNRYQFAKFLEGEISLFPVQIARIVIGVHVRWVEVQEDGELLGDVAVAVGFVFPVAFVDEAALWEFFEPFDHLRADAEGEYSSSRAVIAVVVFGDEDVLVAFSFWDVDIIWAWWPHYGPVVEDHLMRMEARGSGCGGNRGTYVRLDTLSSVLFASESGLDGCRRFHCVTRDSECARPKA